MVLVDTSVWIDVEHRVAAAVDRLDELALVGKAAVSAVTVYELGSGRTTEPSVLARYEALFPDTVPVLPVTLEAARIAARLAGAVGSLSAPDALIAGTALEQGAVLLTSDAAFRRIPGLEVEWMPRPPVLREPVADYAAPPPPAAVAGRLRELRRASGLRACQVAEAAGMARSNYARLEAGRHRPSLATLARAAAALRVPVAELLRAAG